MSEIVTQDDELSKKREQVSVGGGSSTATLQPTVTISDLTSEVFTIRFSPDGK